MRLSLIEDEIWEGGRIRVMESEELGFHLVKTGIKCILSAVYYFEYLKVQQEMAFCLCPWMIYNLTGKIGGIHKKWRAVHTTCQMKGNKVFLRGRNDMSNTEGRIWVGLKGKKNRMDLAKQGTFSTFVFVHISY